MNPLDDMAEKRLHDQTEDHGFELISAAGVAPVDEFPFRGPEIAMDYRQPGFAFLNPKPNHFVIQWPSFVQGVKCKIPEKLMLPDGAHVAVKMQVQWEFGSRANEGPPATTRRFATGACISGIPELVTGELPEAVSIPYDGNYDSSGNDLFGRPFRDTETLVCDLGVVTDGKLVRTTAEGNLFLSRFSRFQSTLLVLNP